MGFDKNERVNKIELHNAISSPSLESNRDSEKARHKDVFANDGLRDRLCVTSYRQWSLA